MRIKLKGSRKVKTVLLCICTVVAIGVIATEGITNRMEAKRRQLAIEQKDREQQEYNEKLEREEQEKKELEEARKAEIEHRCSQADGLFYSRKYDEAIAMTDDIIKEDEDAYQAYNIRGITKIFKYRTLDGMSDIDKSLEIKSDYGYGMFNKALGYELLGHLDDAMEWYNKNLQVEDYVWSYYGIASIYGRRGDVENTVKYLKKAIEMKPEVKSVAADEHDFDPVKNSEEFRNLIKN